MNYVIQGTHGLSLFYLETKNKAGNINGLEIQVSLNFVTMYT